MRAPCFKVLAPDVTLISVTSVTKKADVTKSQGKRGRPKTGQALSAAERKRRQRAAAKAMGKSGEA